jgi:prephenate dehydratase
MSHPKVTLLGNGDTFSFEAYSTMQRLFGAPALVIEGDERNHIEIKKNHDAVASVLEHFGFGVMALATFAEGDIAKAHKVLTKLLNLLDGRPGHDSPPFSIIGAIRPRISICLMARSGVTFDDVTVVVGHEEAIAACQHNLSSHNFAFEAVENNGYGAELVSTNDEFATYAALGPKSAADKYGLHVLKHSFEDAPAKTMFCLLGPAGHQPVIGTDNRALIVCRLAHETGALIAVLQPLADENLNVVPRHYYESEDRYDYVLEVMVPKHQIEAFERALKRIREVCYRSLTFGPFAFEDLD